MLRMWARSLELLVAAWLFASPWTVGGGHASTTVVVVDLAVAVAVVVCALLSMRGGSSRYAHLVAFGIAFGLTVYGWWHRAEPVPVHENHVMVGLVLLMTAVVPTEALRPPVPWQQRHGAPPRD